MSQEKEIRARDVDCHGRRAVVEVIGSGPDVLLVGAAVPMAWTRPTAMALATHGFRVINFDYGTDHPTPMPRTALEQVADTVAVMDEMSLDRPSVVGISRGGITAFALAADFAQRVERLVLVFPVAPFADTLRIADPEPEQEPGESDEQFLRRSLGRGFSDRFLSDHFEAALSLVTTSAGSVTRVERIEEETLPDDTTVTCPTLIIEGEADQIVTPEHPLRYRRAIPAARHVVIPGAHHGWPMEQPGELGAMIAGFLGDAAPAPA